MRHLLAAVAFAVTLPSGWVLQPPPGRVAATGTMPQGMAAAPDGTRIAVVESGYLPASLSVYRVPSLERLASIPLPGAFGRPLWFGPNDVLVAGANADALLDVDVAARTVHRIALPKGSYPVALAAAPGGQRIAVATDGDGAVRIGSIGNITAAPPTSLGGRPGGLAFSTDGRTLFAAVRSSSAIVAVDTVSRAVRRITVGLHPSDVLVRGDKLYAAVADADAVAVCAVRDGKLLARIPLGDHVGRTQPVGVSPNALSFADGTLFVSLGAANSVAVVRDDRLIGRIAAGWYPTDAVALGGRLYVLDGKGEGARPNPRYRNASGSDHDYIGTLERGSLRAYDLSRTTAFAGSPQGAMDWATAAGRSLVRANGPIKHVFFILKENRSYDQVLGDAPGGNGAPALAWFGRNVTPNQHALAARFGLFDAAYTSGEVSASGHMWADAAFANDYVERYWPPLYGRRRVLDDLSGGDGPRVPSAGYLWDAARRAHVSFRDYGELIDAPQKPGSPGTSETPTLAHRFDPYYVGWDLNYSDLDRAREWRREFEAFVRAGTLPRLELIWLPGDHTYGSRAGKLTPASYVAINDEAVGRIVEAISHSRAWPSSAIFIIEDDAQDGPDHVSDQRTTLYVVSPYSRGGVRHEHLTTVGILRTIELILNIPPLSTYDAMAVPFNAAFTPNPDLRPYTALPPKIDVTQRNRTTAYGAKLSARLDFSRPDAVPGTTLRGILARNHDAAGPASAGGIAR